MMNPPPGNPAVSVVIVSWNARDFLLRCIERLLPDLAATRGELIVVDNASSDGSPDAVAASYPSARLIRLDRNTGFAAANNVGMHAAHGRYIFLINSDVDVRSGCLPALVAEMDRVPDVGMAGPRVLNADGSVQASHRPFPSLAGALRRALAMDRHETRGGGDVDILSGCFWVVRREALEKVGLLDERFFMYAEDMDWCRRFHDAGWRVMHDPSVSVVHHGGASSAREPLRFYLEMQRANLQYWRKHHTPGEVACYLAITGLHEILRLFRALALWLFRPSRRSEAAFNLERSFGALRWRFGSRAGEGAS